MQASETVDSGKERKVSIRLCNAFICDRDPCVLHYRVTASRPNVRFVVTQEPAYVGMYLPISRSTICLILLLT